MLSKIFGFFWLVLGILWLIKPDWLRTRLAKKNEPEDNVAGLRRSGVFSPELHRRRDSI